MQDIEELRLEIDQIHDEMVRLFLRRLRLSKEIWCLKQKNALPMIDKAREQVIIHRFDTTIKEADERAAVQALMKSLLIDTKNYLEKK